LVWPDTFAGQIASALDARCIEVLNAAVTSYAPSVYFRKISHLIDTAGLKFDAVAVFLDLSDIQDEARCYRTDPEDNVLDICSPGRRMAKRIKRYLNDNSVSYRLYRTIKDSSRERRWRDAAGLIGSVTGWDRARWTVDDALFERFGRAGLHKADAAMGKLHALLVHHGIPLTLVVYPWLDQILSGDRDSRHARYWRSWSAKRKVRFIDLFPSFVGAGNREATIKQYYLPYDFHFNKAGNGVVSEAFLSAWKPEY
jgi:hypothetical protein